jgi:THO complex subunit 2
LFHLYFQLYPKDEEMEKYHEEYESEVQSRLAGAKNSMLAMAAPLESGPSSLHPKTKTVPPPETKKVETKDTNQKAGLLAALLAMGALKPAVNTLSAFPWLVDSRPEIADLIIRILKVSISPLYECQLVTKERNTSFTHPKARYGPSGVSFPPPRKPVLTLWAPTPPSTHTTDFVFFYPDWIDRVPISTCLDDLENVIEPLMRFIGLHVSRDPLFLTKFLRLGRLHLQYTVPVDLESKKSSNEPDLGHPIRQFWFTILRRYLLPALPLIRGNAVCTVEVWNIIRQYETTMRWRLYGEWKEHTYRSHPELRIRAVQVDRESKGILRRLSLNTVDSLSGSVAKLAHSNPCILFQNAVNQIMAYENLATVVIQALRYVTNMGFDVLVFIILGAFANPDKPRVKDDGVNTSDWLQSGFFTMSLSSLTHMSLGLASFTGMLFRRYSADLTPVLKYIVHQLYNGQAMDIVVLRELIWKMAGIEPLPTLSESQMMAMAGGPTLRIEAIASETRGARLDPTDAVLKGPQRLAKGLLESSLALPLLIQVTQQRQACVYKAPNTHLKSLAGLYDAVGLKS